MGRSYTPQYIIESARGVFLGEWKVRQNGRPTAANLSKWRDAMNQSTRPGGANAHLGDAGLIWNCRIRNQWLDIVVAELTAPSFEVMA